LSSNSLLTFIGILGVLIPAIISLITLTITEDIQAVSKRRKLIKDILAFSHELKSQVKHYDDYYILYIFVFWVAYVSLSFLLMRYMTIITVTFILGVIMLVYSEFIIISNLIIKWQKKFNFIERQNYFLWSFLIYSYNFIVLVAYNLHKYLQVGALTLIYGTLLMYSVFALLLIFFAILSYRNVLPFEEQVYRYYLRRKNLKLKLIAGIKNGSEIEGDVESIGREFILKSNNNIMYRIHWNEIQYVASRLDDYNI
jgi:vacuolar-type H+-ATPase subunit I/STV1